MHSGRSLSWQLRRRYDLLLAIVFAGFEWIMKPSYGYINIVKAFGALRNSFFNISKHGGYLLREKELSLCDFTRRVTCESELKLSRCLYLTPVFGFSPSCISDLFVDRLFPIECCAKKVLTDLYLLAIMHYAKKNLLPPIQTKRHSRLIVS